jgi:hypothetical protein
MKTKNIGEDIERLMNDDKLRAEFNRAQSEISARFNASTSYPDPLSQDNKLIHRFIKNHGLSDESIKNFSIFTIRLNVRQANEKRFTE